METLLWAEEINRKDETRRGRKRLDAGNYSPCGKISSRLTPGQRIEPVYGDKTLSIRHQEKQSLAGTVDYVDTFLRVDDSEPVNVSKCDGANCGQPSLSADGTRIVFIKGR
jgi:hypothetical protein